MQGSTLTQTIDRQDWPDEKIIERVLAGDAPLYELLVRRYNQRLYRVVRGVLRDDAEAEDVMQEAYWRAYQHLGEFEGRATFSTWLIRIAVHEALARLKKNGRVVTSDFEEESSGAEAVAPSEGSPEMKFADTETRKLLEEAMLTLPEQYRMVLMMRDVEQLSTAETATALEISEENVKVRLHRARAMVRKGLFERVGATSSAAFQFHAVRCDRVASEVMRRVALSA
jgi:RNA polymerase sigma-70 factor (ECF subfamily)